MSSLMISTMVWDDFQPCSSGFGLWTRTLQAPGGRVWPWLHRASAAP